MNTCETHHFLKTKEANRFCIPLAFILIFSLSGEMILFYYNYVNE
ncbi:putative membrane protein [Bacillus subtilis MB73/2]|nr:putative membrane protein [Bacillus subtilis MB73/2]